MWPQVYNPWHEISHKASYDRVKSYNRLVHVFMMEKHSVVDHDYCNKVVCLNDFASWM